MSRPGFEGVAGRVRKALQPKGTAHVSKMRRFVLERHEDVSGTSGTGVVAEGVVFTSGHVALTWLSPLWSHEVCQSMDACLSIHGHGGKTRVVFVDQPNTFSMG